jgi:hypothetical protein
MIFLTILYTAVALITFYALTAPPGGYDPPDTKPLGDTQAARIAVGWPLVCVVMIILQAWRILRALVGVPERRP